MLDGYEIGREIAIGITFGLILVSCALFLTGSLALKPTICLISAFWH